MEEGKSFQSQASELFARLRGGPIALHIMEEQVKQSTYSLVFEKVQSCLGTQICKVGQHLIELACKSLVLEEVLRHVQMDEGIDHEDKYR